MDALYQVRIRQDEKNNVAHKTIKVPYIRPGVTEEEIKAALPYIAPALAGAITSVWLEQKTVTTILTPQMREEKLSQELKEQNENAAKTTLSRLAAQSQVHPLLSIPNANIAQGIPMVLREAPISPFSGSSMPQYADITVSMILLLSFSGMDVNADAETLHAAAAALSALLEPQMVGIRKYDTSAIVE